MEKISQDSEGRGPREHSRDGMVEPVGSREIMRRSKAHYNDLDQPSREHFNYFKESSEDLSTAESPSQQGFVCMMTSLDNGEYQMHARLRECREAHPSDQRGYSEKGFRDHDTLVQSVTGALEENERLNLMDTGGVRNQDPDVDMELEVINIRDNDDTAKNVSVEDQKKAKKGRIEHATSQHSPTSVE